jgi:hypothetical protein
MGIGGTTPVELIETSVDLGRDLSAHDKSPIPDFDRFHQRMGSRADSALFLLA